MNFSRAGVNGFGLTILGLFLLFSCHSQEESTRCFSKAKYQAGDGPEGIKIADVNNDRHPDIIIANIKSNDVSIMLNEGRGNFIEAHG
ncbi:MAG: VCBS repeat-containing protein, partial [Pricia sp.]